MTERSLQEPPSLAPSPSPGRGLISYACPDKPGLLQLPLPHRLKPFPTDHVSNKNKGLIRVSALLPLVLVGTVFRCSCVVPTLLKDVQRT